MPYSALSSSQLLHRHNLLPYNLPDDCHSGRLPQSQHAVYTLKNSMVLPVPFPGCILICHSRIPLRKNEDPQTSRCDLKVQSRPVRCHAVLRGVYVLSSRNRNTSCWNTLHYAPDLLFRHTALPRILLHRIRCHQIPRFFSPASVKAPLL